jgi:hypothetical protein
MVGKPEGNRQYGRWGDNIKTYLKEIDERDGLIQLAQERDP